MDRAANRATTIGMAGLVLTVVGLVGYGAGILTSYPGRAFSVVAVMVGITLLSIGNAMRPEGRS